MSKFRDHSSRKDGMGDNGKPAWFDDLHALYPEVACILSGEPADGDKPATPPHSIILSDRKGTLQACISRQDCPDMWFIQLDDPKDLLRDLEAKIAFGEMVYQQKKGKGAGYRPS